MTRLPTPPRDRRNFLLHRTNATTAKPIKNTPTIVETVIMTMFVLLMVAEARDTTLVAGDETEDGDDDRRQSHP